MCGKHHDTPSTPAPRSALHLNPSEAGAYTRREFLGGSLLFASAAISVPAFMQRSALALPTAAGGLSSIPGAPEDRVLVVIQLGGGNDGLNTVVPYGFDEYYRARPGIGVSEEQALKLGRGASDPIGLHPALEGVKSLFDEGYCSIVQGVGYPNPNRSHFTSMDIWQTADLSGTGDGWLGRFMDSECCGFGNGANGQAPADTQTTNHPPISLGREAPVALQGRRVKPVSFETPDLFRWTGGDIHPSLERPYQQITDNGKPDQDNPVAAFLTRTALDARVSSEQIRRAVSLQPLVRYPQSQLSRQLQMVAGMVRAGMKTRVYYVTHGGFDTHAGQGGANGRHANLLRQFASAVRAFYDDLKAQGNEGRVLTMSFSEFGRRVGQNDSGGTDHGTAAPMMLFGPMVNAGAINRHPSMRDLDDGDLKYTTDFRSIYAGVLGDWMGVEPASVLGGKFRKARVVTA
ncbi:MAG: DUF1501 domain-containing protein [Planctomycetota bacterium]